MIETGEAEANRKIKRRVREKRNERELTARETAERLSATGYNMSHSSYRNMEAGNKSGAKMNKRLLYALAKVFNCSPGALATPDEISIIPDRSPWGVKRGERKPAYELKNGGAPEGRWPRLLKRLTKLHVQDPVYADCCEGCERQWPCETYEILVELSFVRPITE